MFSDSRVAGSLRTNLRRAGECWTSAAELLFGAIALTLATALALIETSGVGRQWSAPVALAVAMLVAATIGLPGYAPRLPDSWDPDKRAATRHAKKTVRSA